MQIRIGYTGETVEFSARELKRYIEKIGTDTEISLAEMPYDPSLSGILWLGCDHELAKLAPPAKDAARDDNIYISAHGFTGIIAGANPRAVLIAAYRFLHELGFRWVRPGRDGEILPEKLPDDVNINICEAPSYRHRGICIEGAVSYDHVLNTIEWLPKVGMNCYFNQFFVPFAFFDRWYAHHNNPTLSAVQLTRTEVEGMMHSLEHEIKRRGLMYHAVGHGWTCEPFGIEGLGWDTEAYGIPEIPEETAIYLALVNGKRELSYGIPLNTQLCYSSEYIRERLTTAICDYCAAHPEVGYLHFWLADGHNNHCECEACKDTRPSDYYVMMLNMLDEKLTVAGIDTKVVFLVYADLLWPPEREKILNPSRFTMMFAPITRSYSNCYASELSGIHGELPPFERNKLTMPRSVGDNLTFLNKWREMFDGDSFIFDYHMMWDHYTDPGYTDIAKVLRDDMSGLGRIGLNGMVSCQELRAFFPTGLPVNIMARTLWDKTTAYNDFSAEYYADAFGADGHLALDYTERLTRVFDPDYARRMVKEADAERVRQLEGVRRVVEEFSPVIASNIQNARNGSVRASWEYLRLHGEYCLLLAHMHMAYARGEDGKTELGKLSDWLCANEPAMSNVYDVYGFFFAMRMGAVMSD